MAECILLLARMALQRAEAIKQSSESTLQGAEFTVLKRFEAHEAGRVVGR